MEADGDLVGNGHVQTQFEADQSDASRNDAEGTKENSFLKNSHELHKPDGNSVVKEALPSLSRKDYLETQAESDQEKNILEENVIARGDSQDWALPSKQFHYEQQIVDSAEKPANGLLSHESKEPSSISESPTRDECDVANEGYSIPGKDESQTLAGEHKVEDGNIEEWVLQSKQVQECQGQVVQSPEKHATALPLLESKGSSNISGSSAKDDRVAENEGFSIPGKDKSQTPPSDPNLEGGNSIWEGSCLPREVASSGERTDMANNTDTDIFAEESRTADESKLDSTAPCNESDMLERNVSKISEPHPIQFHSDNGQQQSQATNKLLQDPEIMPPGQSIEENNGFQNEMDSFLDPRDQEWSDLDFGGGESTYISTDMEGWQRFDAEETTTRVDSSRGVAQTGQMWEHLLDDGLESAEKTDAANHSHLASLPAVNENQADLASPGNPFAEESERTSNFSQADSFVCRKELSLGFEETPHLKEMSIDERTYISHPFRNETGTEATKNPVQSSTQTEQRNKGHLQSSSSLDFMEPFEAPSFMSLVDPKSHALFEASMPTYQANQPSYGYESGEKKWVADFDLVAPSTQEINRSISMPRPGSDAPDQQLGQSVSFTSDREQEPNKRENNSSSVDRSLSGLFPPKLSPLVQKVVDKVRSTPAAANGVLNSVRQVVSPKASDKKPSSGSFLTRCMCW